MIFKPITTEAALGTNTGAASNVGKSRYVRLVNTGSGEHLVTLEQSDGTDIGTFTLESLQTVIIQKDPSDQLFAANAAVLACGVANNSY